MTLKDALNKVKNAAGHAFPVFGTDLGPILVTGADGVVSYRVAAYLLGMCVEHSPTVRLGTSNPEAVSELAKLEGAEVVEFDWAKPDTYGEALRGIKSVFISMPHCPEWKEHFDAFLRAAKSAGVKHYVKLSFYHALASNADTMSSFCNATSTNDPFLKVPFVLMHRECDSKLMKTPMIDYAIIFATHFMSNPFVYQVENLKKHHKFVGASHGKGVNYCSPNDVAEVAVRCLLDPKKHSRVGYNVTGPTYVTDEDVARLISDHLGTETKITYEDVPDEKFQAQATDWGPASDVAWLEHVKSIGAEQQEGFASKDVEKVCGRPAESFEGTKTDSCAFLSYVVDLPSNFFLLLNLTTGTPT